MSYVGRGGGEGGVGRSADFVLFIDPANNRLTSLGKQQAGRRRGGEGTGGGGEA